MSIQTMASVSHSTAELQKRASKRKPPKDISIFKKEIQMDDHWIALEDVVLR